MSYLYSNPNYLYQSLHNFMAKVIVSFGRFLGYLWIEKSSTFEFHYGSRRLLIWSTFIAIFLVSSQICTTIYAQQALYEAQAPVLSILLNGMTQVAYNALVFISYWTVLTNRKKIVEICNIGMRFRSSFKNHCKRSCHCYRKNFVYILVFKFLVDFLLIFLGTLVAMAALHYKRNLMRLLMFVISTPLALSSYCFISTIYYVTFVYAAFLVEEIREQLNNSRSSYVSCISHLYARILRFSKKVNNILQVLLLLVFFEAFLGLVNQV